MTQRLYMADVFAERAICGHPLALVIGDEALPDDAMQRVAAESIRVGAR